MVPLLSDREVGKGVSGVAVLVCFSFFFKAEIKVFPLKSFEAKFLYE